MTIDPSANSTNAFFGMQSTCEDLARFGYLFLRQGAWDDEQIVPGRVGRGGDRRPVAGAQRRLRLPLVAQHRGPAAQPAPGRHPDRGARGGRRPDHRPGAPEDMYTAQGLGGQIVMVDPGSETVVVRLGEFQANPRHTYTGQDAARFVTEALVDPSAGRGGRASACHETP